MKALLTILLFISLTAHSQRKSWLRITSAPTLVSYTLSFSYPVSVFSVNNNNIGVAADSSQFKTLWNLATEDQTKGTLSALSAFLFRLALNGGQSAPGALLFNAVTKNYPITYDNKCFITYDGHLITLY